MWVFKLESDKQFIRAEDKNNIRVYEYNTTAAGKDPKDSEMINSTPHSWKHLATIPGNWSGLEVNGVKIPSSQFHKLAEDMIIKGKDEHKLHLLVNRRGICLLQVGDGYFGLQKWLRINDRFGWSKYGVTVPQEVTMRWNMCDMNNDGTVLVGPTLTFGRIDDLDGCVSTYFDQGWKKLHEERDRLIEDGKKVLEKNEALLRKSVEENEKLVEEERKIVERSECLLMKLVEEKRKLTEEGEKVMEERESLRKPIEGKEGVLVSLRVALKALSDLKMEDKK